MNFDLKDITIIIVSFHSSEQIYQCLNSIDKNVEVIIIENSNDCILKKEVESKYKNVTCILSEKNLGFGCGNNLGLSKVKTKFSLILNPDVILEKNSLKNFIIRANEVPDFGIIAPYSKNETYVNFDIELDKFLKEVKDVKGFAMFFNMKNLKKINFFDSNFFLYFEEIDLCKRLILNNYKIYIDPNIEVTHIGGASHNKNINLPMELSRNWHWMWSTVYFNRKHYGYIFSLINILPKLFSSFFKMIIYFLILKKIKSNIYKHRLLGILNGLMLNDSWYRPQL